LLLDYFSSLLLAKFTASSADLPSFPNKLHLLPAFELSDYASAILCVLLIPPTEQTNLLPDYFSFLLLAKFTASSADLLLFLNKLHFPSEL
jgi:hypothetical protein